MARSLLCITSVIKFFLVIITVLTGVKLYKFVVALRCLPRRDNEAAYVAVNGNICWFKIGLSGSAGTQWCGVRNNDHKEERFRVTGCYITLKATDSKALVPLTVRVWTNLDGDANDESFGIDNVLVKTLIELKNEFDNLKDFEGWNCGEITTCGKHQFCGGYNVKGKGSEIKKTFMLPAGTYSVEMDFIKIDSWWVCFCCMCV